MKIIVALSVSALVMFASCKRDVSQKETNPNNPGTPNAASNFQYETSRNVSISIAMVASDDKPLSHSVVRVMDNSYEKGGKVLFTGATDANGVLTLSKLELPTYMNSVVINTSNLLLPKDIILNIQNNNISAVLGGSKPKYFTTVEPVKNYRQAPLGKSNGRYSTKLGDWELTHGVPNYLATNDVIGGAFQSSVSAIFPEFQNFPTVHSSLFSSSYPRTITTVENNTEVWVTFLSEGASTMNTLFYYVYNKNNPPANEAAIDSFYVVYPNASATSSGGNLAAGNRVKIGKWNKDTVIAFGIRAGGFNNTSSIAGWASYYATKDFNPESNVAFREHLVMLYDNITQRLIFGFEDQNRDPGNGADHDFNDMMFYCFANPADGINIDDFPNLPGGGDDDGDGVDNSSDDYPTDPLRAFNNYYGWATAAFEDLWPAKGDFDMNDAVVDYRHKVVTNATNGIKDIFTTATLRASGGSFNNVFMIEYPLAASNVASVSGSTLEGGQSNIVLPFYSSAGTRGLQVFGNTITGEPYSSEVTGTVSFTLTTPVAIATVGLGTYNPFIYVASWHGRGGEVHLSGKSATALANVSLFGIDDDNTNQSSIWYISKDNMPFGISIPEVFDYPLEKESINSAYNHFTAWAQSGGVTNSDWYKNFSGYRNASKIYVHP